MKVINNIEECSGCMTCYQICNAHAISMIPDNKGFLYPVIDDDKCVHCGLCAKHCPSNHHDLPESKLEVYAAWTKDKKIRSISSSGGLFSILASSVIEKGGIVFGAKWDSTFSGVEHTYISTKEELSLLRGSKYVQSFIGKSYILAKQFLDDGKEVLFSGTPCQIEGLQKFLNRNYDNLVTIDLVCHGVPSPKIFKEYVQSLKMLYNSDLISLNLRYKKPSWLLSNVRVAFVNKKVYLESVLADKYFNCFVESYFLRECCYQCKYANVNRVSDITLGDFWGYIPTSLKYCSYDKGTSLVIINTEKGKNIYDIVKPYLIVDKMSIDIAKRGNVNLYKSQTKPTKYCEFWSAYHDFGYNYALTKYSIIQKPDSKVAIIASKYHFLIPKWLKNIVRKFK